MATVAAMESTAAASATASPSGSATDKRGPGPGSFHRGNINEVGRVLRAPERQREHSMATKSSQSVARQAMGMMPVRSSRSILRYDVACANSRARQ